MKKLITTAIYIDSSIIIATRYNFESTNLKEIQKLAEDNKILFILTEITINEIKSKIHKDIHEAFSHLKSFKTNAIFLKYAGIEEINFIFDDLEKTSVENILINNFDSFIRNSYVEIIKTERGSAANVFEKYFTNTPPFESKKDKKSEFPDAFILDILNNWAIEKNFHLYVVSNDKGQKHGCDQFDRLHPLNQIGEFLNLYWIENESSSYAVDIIGKEANFIAQTVKQNFEQSAFILADQDGDVEEIEVNNLDTDQILILYVSEEYIMVQLWMTVEFSANLHYPDPVFTIYDKEDKQTYVYEYIDEEVDRVEKIGVDVKIEFNIKDPSEYEIYSIDMVENHFEVVTNDTFEYPYK